MATNATTADATTPSAPRSTRADGGTIEPTAPAGLRPPTGPPPPRAHANTGPRQWLDRIRKAIAGWDGGTRKLHDFADLVAAERDPSKVEAALVATAGELAGACRVELVLDRDDSRPETEPQLLVVWPETAQAMTPDEIEELGYPLALGLWCGDHYQMSLQLYARPGRGGRLPERVVRRLKTLCSVASAALRGMHAGRRARTAAPSEPPAPVRDATFLCAILPYALSQAQRHCEPVSAFCVAVDRLAELAHTHGPDAVDRAVRRVAEAIARSLRGSDVVARLDDDRILIVLPNTSPRDATNVAEIIRRAVDSACLPVGTLPTLRASMGMASFPDDARDSASLLSAADDAMSRARASGSNCVAGESEAVEYAISTQGKGTH
jgi:diguanylate cyclase (GGDEF)-like protein